MAAASTVVTGANNGCVGPATPRTNVPPEPDPLADRAGPTFSGCDYNNTHVNGKVSTLGPGVYCGGITVTGSTVTFLPGTYVLNGGGLNVSSNSILNGTNVTFYNTGDNKSFSPFSISGGTTGSLSAPTSGPMEGMLFFQDRTITAKATNTLSGGTGLTYEGAFYFPTSALTFSGGSISTANYTIIVADTINITGQSVINADFSSLQNGDPIKRVALAE